MRNSLEAVAKGYDIYNVRRPAFNTQDTIPFRVSPEPLSLSPDQKNDLAHLGHDVTAYLHLCDTLYHTDGRVRKMLDKGKPEIFLVDHPTHQLFVRPDVIITPAGFVVCEIETSPFGLALAEIVNKAYRQEQVETLIGENDLSHYVHGVTPTEGTIVYTDKTKSYGGQLMFLADKVFTSDERKWNTQHVTDTTKSKDGNIYRGFYLSEYNSDPNVRLLIDSIASSESTVLPSMTPHMEEKALLALLWDKRWEEYFRKQLGPAAFNHLRATIPPTWIVGEEKYFSPGMPGGIESSLDLASLSRAKRAFVLKTSGFSNNSSWAEGVTFLHEKSRQQATEKLRQATQDPSTLHIVQEFRKARNIPMTYESNEGLVVPMQARVRLTPYYSASPGREGQLIAIKATGVENTDYIHASTASINTAVS